MLSGFYFFYYLPYNLEKIARERDFPLERETNLTRERETNLNRESRKFNLRVVNLTRESRKFYSRSHIFNWRER